MNREQLIRHLVDQKMETNSTDFRFCIMKAPRPKQPSRVAKK